MPGKIRWKLIAAIFCLCLYAVFLLLANMPLINKFAGVLMLFSTIGIFFDKKWGYILAVIGAVLPVIEAFTFGLRDL